MRVILRLKHGPAVQPKRRKNQQAALAASAFLTPGALMACALALWRLGADMGMVGAFPITAGLWSHWQVWFVAGGSLEAASLALSRYGNAEPTVTAPEQRVAKSDPPVQQRR
jgi:hypothetical protein